MKKGFNINTMIWNIICCLGRSCCHKQVLWGWCRSSFAIAIFKMHSVQVWIADPIFSNITTTLKTIAGYMWSVFWINSTDNHFRDFDAAQGRNLHVLKCKVSRSVQRLLRAHHAPANCIKLLGRSCGAHLSLKSLLTCLSALSSVPLQSC